MNEIFVNTIVMVLGTVITALVSIAMAWIRSHVQSEKVEGALERLEMASMAVVQEMEQTIVQEMKSGGAWNQDSIAKIQSISQQKIKSMLGDPACEIISAAGMELDDWIKELTEQAVYHIRNVRKMP